MEGRDSEVDGVGKETQRKEIDLGNGLKIIKINPAELREQKVNARYMSSALFKALTENIKRSGRLESLPFCCDTGKYVEIISGHHRVRGAIAAGLSEIPVLVNVDPLTHSSVRAKQIAHNAIQGVDNEDIITEMLKEITELEDLQETALDVSQNMKLEFKNLGLDCETKVIALIFADSTGKEMSKILAEIQTRLPSDVDESYVGNNDEWVEFLTALNLAGAKLKIKNKALMFKGMAEAALETLRKKADPVQ